MIVYNLIKINKIINLIDLNYIILKKLKFITTFIY